MVITLRQKARDKGKRWYKSNSVCIHGHVSPVRYTMTGGCRDCLRAKWKTNLPEDENRTKAQRRRATKLEASKARKKISEATLQATIDQVWRDIQGKRKSNDYAAIAKACTCNSNDYRRTLKKTIKDMFAAW